MLKSALHPSFRSVLAARRAAGSAVRVAGAHDALGGRLAEAAGFDAVWASSLEVSAARCLPDASVLTMTEYLEAAANTQKALGIPVVADVDTGYGNNLNVAHMVREYEAAGITAVAIEDKQFPKMNSFVATSHTLLDTDTFASKLRVAKQAQRTEDFFVIARTEALIDGLGVEVALERCHAYVDAGADGVLVHSKKPTNEQVLAFLAEWQDRAPVVVVPTTYPDWHIDDAVKAGVSTVIYANQGLRATIRALRETFSTIVDQGATTELEDRIASVKDIFALQGLAEWQELESA
ncbi:isocitrate lyase/phosphoenolpyruvate mutase family protein [Streptomyces resistomycificus]|uniref:Phosphoenolpyruvate phosphomutase n=1 Tax=Streptomyces resistomycificus TaxID=67356 RepID=A0A0L8KS09_9ACTN|nr:isocitrate lyase/phosphoenolpyruvate mutase family protein [Streptomyces resistomycificus]KOG28529.1 phosphoenolpyruvate phosphomutase [Streptomyces resistomycificus]KUN91187.1 phosphoenolpyruvate phosphomutase [Streptomyces resistomycificus]